MQNKTTENIIDVYELLQKEDNKLLEIANMKFSRSQGPGGQNVNKTSSAVSFMFEELDIKAASQKHRSQYENKVHALKLLREAIALTSTVLPSDTLLFSMKNYFASGIHVNPKNCDYPLILAIITGSFNHFEGNHKKVSEYLKTTPSQVVKFITDNKHLLEKINSIRKKFNKPNLH